MTTVTDIANQYGATYTPPSVSASSPIQMDVNKYGATYTPPESDLSKGITAWTGVQNPDTYFKDALTQAGDFIVHPIKTTEDAVGAFVDTYKNAFGAATTANEGAINTISGDASFAQKTASLLHAVGADASLVFAPISGAFAAASKFPVLKEAADVLAAPFAATGKIGDFVTEKFINVLPIDQTSKDVLAPAFGEVGALAGQILLGGKVMDLVSKGIAPDKAMVDKAVAETKAETEIAKQHAQSPEVAAQKYGATYTPADIAQADYAKSQGYEPYTPSAELPTIDVGKASNGLPTIQTEAKPSQKMGSLTVEPIRNEPTASAEAPKAASVPNVASKSPVSSTDITPRISTDVAQTVIDRPILDNGMRVAKAANDINEQLVTKGMKELPPDQLAQYQPKQLKDVINRIDSIMSNIDNAKDIINGKAALPSDIPAAGFWESMKNYADLHNDTQLHLDLARSKLGSEGSKLGQGLSFINLLRKDGRPDTVKAIKEVDKILEKKTKAKSEAKAKDLQSLKSEVKSVKPNKQTWVEFIRSVKC